LVEEEIGDKKQASKVHILSILTCFFSTHGFHVPINGFSTSHGLFFFCPYCGFQLLVLHALMFHTLRFCVLGTKFPLLVVWRYFLSMWIWNSSHVCTLVPYMRVLCPWEHVSNSQGLNFVRVDLNLWSCKHSLMCFSWC
jgi:hypothetical protein